MSSDKPDHDATITVFDASDRLGKKLPSWKWSDDRRTVTPDEHMEINQLTDRAKQKVDIQELEHRTVLAHIWMDDEAVERVEWNEEYTDPERTSK